MSKSSNAFNDGRFILTSEFATSHRPIKLARIDDFPSKGQTAYVHYRTSLLRSIIDEAAAVTGQDKVNKLGDIVVECAVNEDGSPMFTSESIQSVPSDTVMLIYKAIVTNNSEEIDAEKKS